MNKTGFFHWLSRIGAFSAFLAVSFIVLFFSKAFADNLLPSTLDQWNYSFEGGSTADDPNWEELGTASYIDNSGTQVHSGSRSCLLQKLASSYSYREILSATCTVASGSAYTAGIWCYVPAISGGAITDVQFEIAIRWYDSSNTLLSQSSPGDKILAAFDSWEKITYSTTAPTNATQARLLISAKETNDLDYDPYIDDGEFSEADLISPAAISDLTALTGTSDGTVTLRWTAPGDDGTGTADVTSYEVRYATYAITSSNYSNATVYSQSWTPASFGTQEGATGNRVVSGLSNGTTYWFAIKASDGSNWSIWPDLAIYNTGISTKDINAAFAKGIPDHTPPAAVSDLTALTGDSGGTVKLKWTAPGDDGTGGGNVTEYLVKYATYQITAANFYDSLVSTYTAASSWTPATFGTEEGTTGNRVVSGLTEGVTYYFAIKAKDESDNWSSWSDIPYSGNINKASAGVTPPTPAPTLEVVINEIAYKGTQASSYDEWYELYNNTGGDIDLTGWTLSAADGTPSIALSGTIVSKGFFLLERSSDTDVSPAANQIYAGATEDTGEDLKLTNSGGATVDEVDCTSGWFVSLSAGYSMERKDPTSSGSLSSNWAVCITTGPETDANGTQINGTPGRQNSVYEIFDSSAPAAIQNLSALTGSQDGSVTLTWTAPGDDGTVGDNTGGYYIVRFETFSVTTSTQAWWNNNLSNQRKFSSPVSAGQTETRTVTSLTGGVTYYFSVKTFDSSDNGSGMDVLSLSGATQAHACAYSAPQDSVAPAAISDLAASQGTAMGTIDISWTAPGDDGMTGTASGYVVKYSQSQITDANFDAASTYSQSWTPKAAGQIESYTLSNLSAGTLYYVAVKAYDDNPAKYGGPNYGIWPDSQYVDGGNSATTKSGIVINEILPNPNGTDGGSEFIELYNNSSSAVDISNWVIQRGGSSGWANLFTITSGTIPANGWFLLGQSNVSPIPDFTYGDTKTMYNSNGGIRLLDNLGSVMDTIVYGGTDPYGLGAEGNAPASSVQEGYSFSRSPDGNDTDNNSNDFTLGAPSPTNVNGPDTTAPSAITDLAALTGSATGQIVLTWTAPGDDGTSGNNQTGSYYEIKYATYPSSGSDASAWYFRANPLPVSISVAAKGATETLTVTLSPGTTYYFAIKTVDWSGNVSDVDTLTSSGNQAHALSYPGEFAKHIVINEISTKDDWVELYNPSSSTQNINGWSLWSMYGEKEIITFGNWNFPGHAYLVVDFSEDSLTPIPYKEGNCYKALSTAEGISASSEDGIILYSSSSVVVDAVVYSDNDYYYFAPSHKSTEHDITSLSNIDGYNDLVNSGQWYGVLDTGSNRSEIESWMVFGRYLLKYTSLNPYLGKYSSSELSNRSLARRVDGADDLSSKNEWCLTDSPSQGSANSSPDDEPPATISDLQVTSGENPGTLKLKWTAPGDDGMTGTASGYVVRYSKVPINYDNFDNFNEVNNWVLSLIWYPKTANSSEEYLLGGLEKNTTYYVSILAEDENGNRSFPSNCASASAGNTVGSFIRLNEIAPQEADGKDWIEIYNAYSSTVDLSGWKLYQRSLNLYNGKYEEEDLYDFPSFKLPAGDYLVLEFMTDGTDGTYQTNSDGSKCWFLYVKNQSSEDKQIDETKDWIVLRDAGDVMIDCVFWSNRAGLWDADKWAQMISAASDYHQWSPNISDEKYTVDTSAMAAGESINRNESSNDTDDTLTTAKSDWKLTGQTKGFKNDWTAPSAVTDLSVSAGTNEGEVTLEWTAPGDDGTSGNNSGGYYEVKYSTVAITVLYPADLWWSDISDVPGYQGTVYFKTPANAGTRESKTITGLYPGKQFYFCVKTVDDVGNVSDISNSANLTVADQTPPVLTEAMPAWVRSSATSATIYWKPGPFDVVFYEVERKLTSKPDANYVFLGSTTFTSWTSTNLTSGNLYDFRVRARDAGGKTGAWLVITVPDDRAFPLITAPSPFPTEVHMIGNDMKFNLRITDNQTVDVTPLVYCLRSSSSITVTPSGKGIGSKVYDSTVTIPSSFVEGGDFSYYITYGDQGRSIKTATVNVSVSRSSTVVWQSGTTFDFPDGNAVDGSVSIEMGSVKGTTPSYLKVIQSTYTEQTKGTEEERVDTSVNSAYPVICWEFQPLDSSGNPMDVKFQSPVSVTLLYLDSNSDGNVELEDNANPSPSISESRLKAYFLDERNNVWRYIGGAKDPVANTISFKFPHLSKFAVFATKAGIITPARKFVTFRTPADFGDAESVEIYDVRGRRVVSLTKTPIIWYGCDEESKIPSSPSDMVESGAYVYKSKKGSEEKTGVIVVVK